MVASSLAHGTVARAQSPAAGGALASGDVERSIARGLGTHSFLRPRHGGVLVRDDIGAPAEARARRFLERHGGPFGLSASDRASLGSVLRVSRVDTEPSGAAHVRFSQVFRGLPVFGGELVVHVDSRGVTAVNGTYVPDIRVSTQPRIPAQVAEEAAVKAVAELIGAASVVRPGELGVYRTGLIEGIHGRSHLTYAVEVAREHRRFQVWLDAENGAVLNRIPLTHEALDRVVYTPTYDPNDPDLFVARREGDPPSLLPPVNNLYDFTGDTYRLFKSAFGRDSYDGAGATMRTAYVVNEACPNAYYNGEATYYCPGWDLDDIVAHEWGHAYTDHTHDLIYQCQPGALNESYSDIVGEIVDLMNDIDGIGGSNNGQPYPDGQRWLVGEDLGKPLHEQWLRDMWNPERLGDPAKVSSAKYACLPNDGFGVHTNSGVPNHAFAILVDGKEFNGQTVIGIGLTKAAHIYFRAMERYQTPTTDFPAHEQALRASCGDLVGAPLTELRVAALTELGGSPSISITTDDCTQLANAMRAVEMSDPPAQCGFQPMLAAGAPGICDGAGAVLRQDWESGMAGWTTTSDGVYPEWPGYHWTTRGDLPDGRAGSAAFAVDPRGGTCSAGGDYSGTFSIQSPTIQMPADPNVKLRFDHYVATELDYDGGNVLVSVNDGEFELVPTDAYEFNGPQTTLAPAPPIGLNTNPKAGQRAWHGTDEGEVTGSWGTTIVNLGLLTQPGNSVRLRFEFGIDGCNGITGWFVDDIVVYTCPDLTPLALSFGADRTDPDPDGSYTLQWARPEDAGGPDTIQETPTPVPLFHDDASHGLSKWVRNHSTPTTSWDVGEEKPQHDSPAFRVIGRESIRAEGGFEATMTTGSVIEIPSEGSPALTFAEWFLGEPDDKGFVEILAPDDGGSWRELYRIERHEPVEEAVPAYESEPLASRRIELGDYRGKEVLIRFRYVLGPSNYFFYTPIGWYVDDITVDVDSWRTIATTDSTFHHVTGRMSGTYGYRVRSAYALNGQVVAGPWSNVVMTRVDRPDVPDLVISELAVSPEKRSSQKFTVSAVVSNVGVQPAGGTKTEFFVEGHLLAVVDTPTLAPGASATVATTWQRRGEKGTRVFRSSADATFLVEEADERNNDREVIVTLK